MPRATLLHPSLSEPGWGGLLAPIVQRRKPSLRKGSHLRKVTPPESNGAQVEGPRCPGSRPRRIIPPPRHRLCGSKAWGDTGTARARGLFPHLPSGLPGCSAGSGGCARRGTLSPVTWPPPPGARPGTWPPFLRAQGSHPAGGVIFPVTVTQLWNLGGRSRPPLCAPREPDRPGEVSGVPGGRGDPGAP